MLLAGFVYWSRFGVAAVIDAATQPVRAVRWQPHPDLGPTPAPARFKWITELLGLAALATGVFLAGFCALRRVVTSSWPPEAFVWTGWTAAVAGWLVALLLAGSCRSRRNSEQVAPSAQHYTDADIGTSLVQSEIVGIPERTGRPHPNPRQTHPMVATTCRPRGNSGTDIPINQPGDDVTADNEA